ncbi:MAG TPA: helix-turn-helix domain-containing protein [Verrucomicrobiae bacterium]|jgi:transcriptional regulator with XRE-family HTH domain|nr:helix-turn-helix domain-containing protein [Verrucomicrobiae bacterium]
MSQDPNWANAEKLRAARQRLGLSQAALAALLPMDRAYLSELENGRKRIHDWVLDKVDKLQREHGGLPAAASGEEADLPLILEAVAAGQSARFLMETVRRITADARISDAAKALCGEFLSARARVAAPAPAEIHGLNSELTAAQRADAPRQRALAQRASQELSPSPKAGGPSGGKGSPKRGTGGGRKPRRSPRGPAPA